MSHDLYMRSDIYFLQSKKEFKNQKENKRKKTKEDLGCKKRKPNEKKNCLGEKLWKKTKAKKIF